MTTMINMREITIVIVITLRKITIDTERVQTPRFMAGENMDSYMKYL